MNEKVKLRVIWSLQENTHHMLPDDLDNDLISVYKFIPQVEIMNHPATSVAMLHCGFGETLEIISAGKPLLAWPGFGDQPINAKCL